MGRWVSAKRDWSPELLVVELFLRNYEAFHGVKENESLVVCSFLRTVAQPSIPIWKTMHLVLDIPSFSGLNLPIWVCLS